MASYAAPVVIEESQKSLLKLAQQGDKDAFDTLVRRYERQVVATAHYLTGNLDDARDVAQEVYIKLVRHARRLSSDANLAAWLRRVTVNAARDHLRRRRYFQPLETVLSFIRPAEPVADDQFRGRLVAALNRLSFNERAAFILREVQELETSEVARILECKEVTVRGHLMQARQKLRKHLADLRGNR